MARRRLHLRDRNGSARAGREGRRRHDRGTDAAHDRQHRDDPPGGRRVARGRDQGDGAPLGRGPVPADTTRRTRRASRSRIRCAPPSAAPCPWTGCSSRSTASPTSAPERGRGMAAAAPVTRAEFDAVYAACSTWGVWGPGDRRGALNHITPEIVTGGGGAHPVGADRVVFVGARHGGGARQPEAGRAPHDAAARRPPGRLGRHAVQRRLRRRGVPRRVGLAHRRAVPRGLPGDGLQRRGGRRCRELGRRAAS